MSFAANDVDRAWFRRHQDRLFRLRRPTVGELGLLKVRPISDTVLVSVLLRRCYRTVDGIVFAYRPDELALRDDDLTLAGIFDQLASQVETPVYVDPTGGAAA